MTHSDDGPHPVRKYRRAVYHYDKIVTTAYHTYGSWTCIRFGFYTTPLYPSKPRAGIFGSPFVFGAIPSEAEDEKQAHASG